MDENTTTDDHLQTGSTKWLKINESVNSLNDLENNFWLNSRVKIIKNLVVIGFAWIFLFTSFQAVANLQSSLNSDQGLGTASLSCIYVSLVLSCLFVPSAIINNLGLKWTIVVSQCAYILFIAANMFPRWYTLLPTAIILGIGAAPLWIAKCTYLTEIGGFYARLSGETSEAVVNRFFGIFFAMFQSSQIWGNIISAAVLKPETVTTNSSIALICGYNDCPGNPSVDSKKPQLKTVYILCGIYLAFAISSIIFLIVLLDKFVRVRSDPGGKAFTCDLLTVTVKHLRHKYQLLLIPFTLWSGFEQAFLSADFTRSYVTCTRGVEYVGLVLICYGVADVIGSYGFGFLVKYIGRLPCFIIASVLNYTVLIVMLFWIPNSKQVYVLFIMAAMWGCADGAWQTQINALYGVLFQNEKEAAFSNYRLWESLGFAIAYAYSVFTCVSVKLYILLGSLTIGLLCYFVVELLEWLKSRQEKTAAIIRYNNKSNTEDN